MNPPPSMLDLPSSGIFSNNIYIIILILYSYKSWGSNINDFYDVVMYFYDNDYSYTYNFPASSYSQLNVDYFTTISFTPTTTSIEVTLSFTEDKSFASDPSSSDTWTDTLLVYVPPPTIAPTPTPIPQPTSAPPPSGTSDGTQWYTGTLQYSGLNCENTALTTITWDSALVSGQCYATIDDDAAGEGSYMIIVTTTTLTSYSCADTKCSEGCHSYLYSSSSPSSSSTSCYSDDTQSSSSITTWTTINPFNNQPANTLQIIYHPGANCSADFQQVEYNYLDQCTLIDSTSPSWYYYSCFSDYKNITYYHCTDSACSNCRSAQYYEGCAANIGISYSCAQPQSTTTSIPSSTTSIPSSTNSPLMTTTSSSSTSSFSFMVIACLMVVSVL